MNNWLEQRTTKFVWSEEYSFRKFIQAHNKVHIFTINLYFFETNFSHLQSTYIDLLIFPWKNAHEKPFGDDLSSLLILSNLIF